MAPIENGDLRRLRADLGRAGAEAERRAGVVVRKVAFDIVRDAKAIAHQKFSSQATGATANSINAKVSNLEAEIGPTTYYAWFVENGTSRMAPKPFMGPAADRHEDPFAQAMAQIVEEALG